MPPLCVVKTKISTAFGVLVNVGAVPPGHLTELGQVIVYAVPEELAEIYIVMELA